MGREEGERREGRHYDAKLIGSEFRPHDMIRRVGKVRNKKWKRKGMRGWIKSSSRPIETGTGSTVSSSVVGGGGGGTGMLVVPPAEKIEIGQRVSCFVNHPVRNSGAHVELDHCTQRAP